MTAIVYPGTFDPITNGHIDLVERAAKLFDRVIVAIAYSEKKQPLFDLEQRTELCKLALAHVEGVEIQAFTGLLTEFVATCDTHITLRGVRTAADFEYEIQLASMNQAQVGNAVGPDAIGETGIERCYGPLRRSRPFTETCR